MQINWYPGHMAKARRELVDLLRVADLLVEVRDARVPVSSANPDLSGMGSSKPRITVLNKADLADPKVTAIYTEAPKEEGPEFLALNARTSKGFSQVRHLIDARSSEISEAMRRKGRRPRAVRMVVLGIPNVGKSTIINQLARRKAANTGNTPGVTRGHQWIRVSGSLELLDTPGLLWPNLKDPEVGLRLAAVSSIGDKAFEARDVVRYLLRFLSRSYPGSLSRYLSLDSIPDDVDALIEAVARAKGCLQRGGKPDEDRAVKMALKDFRAGRLGRVTLDQPDVSEGTGGEGVGV